MFQAASDPQQSTDMVAVLVRHQNCVERIGGFPDEREAPLQLPETQAGIDEDARPVGGDECHVAGTTAGQDAKLYDRSSP